MIAPKILRRSKKRLWSAADTLRDNSNLAANEFFMSVMGLSFLGAWPNGVVIVPYAGMKQAIDIPNVHRKRLRSVPTHLNPHLEAIRESESVVCFRSRFTATSRFFRIASETEPSPVSAKRISRSLREI
jgi:hypothetical protein